MFVFPIEVPGELDPLSFHKLCVQMQVNKTKFERNSSLGYYHMTCFGKTALASHQCGPGSNPGVDAICGLSLLLVLSLAPRGFSPGAPVFPSPQKPTYPNSNSTRNQVDEEPLCGCATCKSLFIHSFIYLGFRTRWCHISHTTSKTHAL